MIGRLIIRLYDRWYRFQRGFDVEYLWPACCEQAGCIEQARAAFACHAYQDPAWLWLGDDLEQAIAKLERPVYGAHTND